MDRQNLLDTFKLRTKETKETKNFVMRPSGHSGQKFIVFTLRLT
jgi:hypothetical protein